MNKRAKALDKAKKMGKKEGYRVEKYHAKDDFTKRFYERANETNLKENKRLGRSEYPLYKPAKKK